MSNRLALPFSRSELARLPGNAQAFMAAPPVTRHLAAVPGYFPSSLVAEAAAEAQCSEIRIAELRFRHLRTAAEIGLIKHLREEIRLPVSALADPGFQTREKKETRRALSALSSAPASSSGPSDSCRWAAD